MKKKLTSKIVEHLKVSGPKRMDVWDTVLQGFGTRVSATGRKVWFVVVRTNGRLRRVTLGTYPAIALAEAREEARKIIGKAQLGVLDEPAQPARQTLGELVPLFIQLYARPKNRDWKETEHVLAKFASLFDKDVNAIRRPDVVRVLDGIVSSGTPYRANRALAALKKLMNWALDRGIIEINPIAGLKPPHKEQARDRVLSDIELAILLNVADAEGYPFGDMFKILVFTGQRRGEVTGMRWSEIDWTRRVWTISSVRSKNQQSHEVPLAEPVLQLLRSTPRFLGSDYVFTTTGNTPISGFSRAKRRVYAAVATTDWRTHDLRRTAASGMARLGVPPHVVEKVLNHKSGIISGVAAVYNRYGYEKEKRDALGAWADHVEALRGTNAFSSNGGGHKTNPDGMVSAGPRPLA